MDVKVRVLYGSEENDIISQYVTFSKVYNEQMKLHGRTRETIMETIRICKDKNVLREYLVSREKEGAGCPVDIRFARTEVERRVCLLCWQCMMKKKFCVIILRAKEAAIEMLKGGKLSVEEIAQYVPALSVDDVKKLQKELMQCV